jgi:hypothetical protein
VAGIVRAPIGDLPAAPRAVLADGPAHAGATDDAAQRYERAARLARRGGRDRAVRGGRGSDTRGVCDE